jgi:hypothetical protein
MFQSKSIVRPAAMIAALAAAAIVSGCASSGMSERERPGQTQASYIRALYDAPPATVEVTSAPGAARVETPVVPQAPFQGPAKVVVAQIGEVAPPTVMLDGLRRHPAQFAKVEALPAVPEQNHYAARRSGNAQEMTDAAVRDHIESLCRTAGTMNMDYLLLVGGTIDQQTNATPLSLLNLTIVGAFIVPSDQTRAHVKASGAMIDLRTRQVVSVSSAEVQGGHLTPAASTAGENVQLFKRLTNQAAAKLADQVVADCGGASGALAQK